MSMEWKFAFLHTDIIIFCLIYSLNIPHSNQNPSCFSWFIKILSINGESLLYILATVEIVTQILFWHFFSRGFTIVTGDGLLSGFDDKYKLQSELIRNFFYLYAAMFETPMWCFIRKPPAYRGTDVSIEIYQLLLLFSITSPCS